MSAFVSKLLRRRRSPRARNFWAEPLEQRLLLTRLAVIGDYSSDVQTAPTRDVSNLVKSWTPDGIVTAGDNNYPGGAASTIDANIGQWYHQFISPYTGGFGAGSADGQNHFWPTLGNHDWDPGNVTPYTNYFTLPNNERYYTVQIGNIALFVCDGEPQEPDGTSATSVQGQWIHNAMINSTATWKLVLYHEPVYSSGLPSNPAMNWPFQSWGATAIINGHMHGYERLIENGMTYITDGLGGESIFSFGSPIAGSQVRYDNDYGALRVDSTTTSITFTFVTRTGTVIDSTTIGNPVPNPPANPHATASPGQIALSWSASSGATSYSVYRGTSPNGEGATAVASNLTATAYTDTSVTAGATYYYVVTAKNAAGESARSVEASAALAAPPAPANVIAQGGITQTALKWSASAGAATYNVYRGTSPGAEGATALASNLSATSFTDSALAQGATFYYTVKAVNGFGPSPASAEASATVMSPPAHVVVVIESHFDPVVIQEGASGDPYIQSLMDGGALFGLAQGVTYPGQPNYLALFSGSTQGVTDDTVPSTQFTGANLSSELTTAGLSFTGYAQSLPSAGSLVTSSGAYFRYHNPWSEFSNVPAAGNQPFTSFPANFAALPTVSFVVPDFNNDMHDGTVAQADTWLQTNLGAYATWALTHNSLLVVTWDDNVSGSDPANPIATILYGQNVQPGAFSDTINHYGVLRTIEDLYGVPRLGSAATASPIQDAWHAVPLGPPAPTSFVAAQGGTQLISLSWTASAGATSYNIYRGAATGGEAPTPVATGLTAASFNDSALTPGVTYFYQVTAVNASGESPRSAEASATTQKASPIFGGLTSPIITYGAASTTLSGTIAAGTLVPTGNVSITINGVAVNAAITAGTGAFSTSFDTHSIPASATAYTITFAFAGNANFNSAGDTGQTLTVNKRSLTVTATGISRVYDGATAATVTPADNRINSDALTITYASAAFADKAIGTGKTVNVSGISLSGAAAGNYTLANTTATATANITARPLTVSATGANRPYDGTTTDAVTLTDNRVAGDIFTDAFTAAAFATKTVGTGKTVSVAGISISGPDAGNYTSNTTASTTANISVRTLNPIFTGVAKIYDGATSATVTTSDDRIIGDVLTISDTATFASKTVGAGKTVNVTGIALAGADSGNYVPASATASTTAAITARPLTVTATGVNKIYDATTSATVNLTDNHVAGDVITDGSLSATFADKNVGAGKTISVGGISLGGADAPNYSLTSTTATATANISAKPLTISATGVGKVYDGTVAATVALSDNRINGDSLTASYASAAFASKNVGAGKTISVSGIGITGTDAGNYSPGSTTASAAADITARPLTVTASGIDKVYDRTATATVTLSDNHLAGDAVTDSYASASFADKTAAAGKTVGVTGIAIAGADAANYSPSNTTASATAAITPRALTVTATGVNKTYDGTASASVTLADNRLAGDALTDGYASATFSDKNVGAAKPISLSDVSVTGADASNYALANPPTSAAANIAALSITANITAAGKVYDATTTASLLTRTLGGVLGTDAVTLSGGSASFDTKNVGAGKTVTATGLTLAGADAGNYLILNSTPTTTADITALAVSGSFTASNKIYDATAVAAILTRSLTGVPGGDAVTLSGGSAAFDTKNAGTGKTVSATDFTLAGADLANYSLSNPTETTTADITPLGLTGSVTAADKVYDATTTAALLTRNLSGVLGTDDVGLTGGNASFDTRDVGPAKTVNVAALALGGADAPNYLLSNSTETTTAAITPAPLSGSVTASGKPYDGATLASVSARNVTGVLAPDSVTLTGGTAAFDTKNVGAAKTVTVTGLTLSGPDAGNYALSNSTETTTADITPELIVTGTSATDDFRLVPDATPGFVDWFIYSGGHPQALGQLTTPDAAGLTINGSGGSDTLLLDFSTANPLPATLHLNGTFTLNGLPTNNTLALANTTLEIGASTLYFAYTAGQSPADLIRQALFRGYNNGAWTGAPDASTGAITSSNAATGPANVLAVGYADSADGIVAAQPANTVEVRFTVMGDANLDRVVNMADALRLQANYNAANSPSWTQGNFNFDTAIDSVDAILMARNFNATTTGAPAMTAAATPAATAPPPASTSSGASGASTGGITPVTPPTVPVTSTTTTTPMTATQTPIVAAPSTAVPATPAISATPNPAPTTPSTTPPPTPGAPSPAPVTAKTTTLPAPTTPTPQPVETPAPTHHKVKKPRSQTITISAKPRHR